MGHYIQSGSDVDFYRFVLEKESSVKISFKHEPFDSEKSYWRLRLYSNNSESEIENLENESVFYVSGNSPGIIDEIWNDLPAGTYYLKVESYHYSNSDYKLVLSQ